VTDKDARTQAVNRPAINSDSQQTSLLGSMSYAWRALRHRNFKLFFFGQSISLIGTWMTRLATTWLVYRLTHSALLLGIVTFAGQIVSFAVGPVAGVWVERLNRRKLLVWTQAVTQIFLTGIASSSGVESTARSAYDYGYNVVLVVDAMTDRDADAHRHSVEKIFPRLGQTDTTDNVLKVLRG
jgi:Isochorismatase family/Transmembrane secretion effector